jgi:hypothetical protein
MINEKNIFLRLNYDNSLRSINMPDGWQMGDFLNCENMRVGYDQYRRDYTIGNLASTTLLYDDYPSADNLTIGTTCNFSRQRLIWFNSSDTDDGIYAYDLNNQTTYIVLLSSQTVDGFNFDRSNRIDRNARCVGDLLCWTDNNNEPCCINMERGIKLNQPSYDTDVTAYATPIPYETLTLIKRPPIYPLDMTKSSDGGFENNYIENNAYQFTAYYVYKDYQESALAPYSPLAPYNAAEEDSNYIQVQFSFSENIPDYVQSVVLCVRYGNTGKTFIIHQWDKDYFYDLAAIESHNAGSVQLGFNFYDSTIGIAVDDITANTSFHAVALKAKTLEAARNRIFLSNVLKGYDTPVSSSLEATLVSVDTGTGGSYSGTWGYVTLHANFIVGGCQDDYMYPFVYIASGAPQNFYYFSSVRNSTIWNGGVGTVPGSIDINTSSFGGTTEAQLINFLKVTQYPYSPSCTIGSPTWQVPYDISAYNALGNVTVTNFTPVSVNRFFKSSSDYEINIEFKDRDARKCGVIKTGVTISIPARTYGQTEFTTQIQWALTNIAAITQIPDWAYYYQIVIKKNQTTRFFEQIRATGVQYVTKNQDDTYTYGNTYTFGTTYALGINISALTNYGLGYTFSEGDFANLILSDETFLNLRVLGQDGNYVWLSPTNVGTGDVTTIVFLELRTPYKPSETEPYFETPNVYQVSNPGTINRAFSTLSGTINGDTYAIEREDSGTDLYIVEAMSPNDRVWQIWQTDTGFVNFVDTIGQQLKETNIDWSDTYIGGTKINGLNNFEPLNTKNIGSSSGSIQKLQLSNKMEEAGDVMICIAETQPLSLYLGEVMLYKAAQSDGLFTTDDVIGSINPLKNSFGTINPESVVEYNGTIFWFDAINGVQAQYADNGVVAISDYKMHRFFDRYAKRYIEQGRAAIEALCGFSYISSCVDPSTGELLCTLPQTEVNVVTSGLPVGFAPELPSYTTLPSYASSIQARWDFYDGQPKTVVFKWKENRWTGAYQWTPDCMEYLGNKLFGFKNGELWLFNESESSFNTIFGTQYPQRIVFPCNQSISVIKDVFDTAIEGNQIPNYSVLYTDYPEEQITDLVEGDYTNKEGVQYARWFRDRLSPTVAGTAVEKMVKGDVMKSAIPLVMLEFQVYDEELIINFINLGYAVSAGHANILPKPKT